KSGIAAYSAELLPELARFYEIDLIVDQADVVSPWLTANFPARSVAWFDENVGAFDRILYHFGNSEFHGHMLDLLERHPGIVVLHDFFLSGLLNWLEHAVGKKHAFPRALFHSHGYPALQHERDYGREAGIWKYPCNRVVIDSASGIIVHSRYSINAARQWYG